MMKDWLLALLNVGLYIFGAIIGIYIIKLISEFIFGSNLVFIFGV